jgi:hypothetical protein
MKQGIQFGERFTEQLEVIPLFASCTGYLFMSQKGG